jgi:hypothetical protein
MRDYDIKPPSLHCAASGRVLQPGEPYYSVLAEAAEGFERRDFAADVWAGPPQGAIGFWRAKVPDLSGPKRPKPIDDGVLLNFFERLAGETDDMRIKFRYILALLLMRRKLVKLVDAASQQGRETIVVRVVVGGDEHQVVNPGLSEEQFADVQQQLEQLLQSSLG